MTSVHTHGYSNYMGGGDYNWNLIKSCVGLLFVGYEYDPFLYLSVGLSVCDVVMIGGDHHHWLQSIWLASSCPVGFYRWGGLLAAHRSTPWDPHRPLNYICWQPSSPFLSPLPAHPFYSFCFRIFLLLPIVSGQATTAAAAPFARMLLLFRPVRDL